MDSVAGASLGERTAGPAGLWAVCGGGAGGATFTPADVAREAPAVALATRLGGAVVSRATSTVSSGVMRPSLFASAPVAGDCTVRHGSAASPLFGPASASRGVVAPPSAVEDGAGGSGGCVCRSCRALLGGIVCTLQLTRESISANSAGWSPTPLLLLLTAATGLTMPSAALAGPVVFPLTASLSVEGPVTTASVDLTLSLSAGAFRSLDLVLGPGGAFDSGASTGDTTEMRRAACTRRPPEMYCDGAAGTALTEAVTARLAATGVPLLVPTLPRGDAATVGLAEAAVTPLLASTTSGVGLVIVGARRRPVVADRRLVTAGAAAVGDGTRGSTGAAGSGATVALTSAGNTCPW